MHRMTLWAAAALLAAIAVQPATADDGSVCESGRADSTNADAQFLPGDEQIEACSRLLATTYYHRGSMYTSYKHDYDRAIADYSEAIRLDPKLVPAYHSRGMVYYFKHDYDRAIADFDRALKLDPKNGYIYDSRGNAYLTKGDYDRAIADLDQAIRLERNPNPSFYMRRSEAYNRKGDYDSAVADANEAIRLFPEYVLAYNNRGEAYEGKNDPDHAIADFDHALKLAPSFARARQGLERMQALLAKRSNPGAQTNAPPR
jgi:tetratricopeptide (TPR) repeat protein